MEVLRMSIARFAIVLVFVAGLAMAATAQQAPAPQSSGGEKTVEESYLQESLETMIIREQSQADSRDMKFVALQYIKQALDAGRKNDEIRKSLEYLALETTNIIVRSGGQGRPMNNYPDIRAKACEYLGEYPSVETKDALVKVVLGDNEPMVLSAAIRSLGRIGINEGDEVTQTITFIVNRYDILFPDNSLAFEALVAFERIADKTGGLKDPAAIRAIMRIATGNYINPVRSKASTLLAKLKAISAQNQNGSGK
jgi:hypothetical protein